MAQNSNASSALGWALATCAYGEMEQLGSKQDSLNNSQQLMIIVMMMTIGIKHIMAMLHIYMKMLYLVDMIKKPHLCKVQVISMGSGQLGG